MFKNEFQGGPYVEVFSAQGRDPVAKWRLSGSASTKHKAVYDKDVKSFVYILEGETTTTKMTLPKDERQSLWLVQRYLIIQLFVPLGHSFSLEFGVTDTGNNKRRILLSSNHRDVTVTQLHARFPLSSLRLGVWLNLCLDLNSLVGETFKGQSFKALENLAISASCRLRKIFTMKLQPIDTTDDDETSGSDLSNSGEFDNIPRSLQFATSPDIQHCTQVINVAKLRQAEVKAREIAGLPPPSTPVLPESDTGGKLEGEPTHIAFGSKIVIPKHARKSSREGGAGSASGRSSGLDRSSSIPQLRTVSPQTEEESGRDSSRQTHRLYYQRSFSDATELNRENSKSQLGIEATQTPIQPRPPRTGSGGKTRRRPVRVRNPGSSKVQTVEEKNINSSSIKTEANGTKNSVVSEKDLDSNTESISRSQSESSLKMSGNESSLGESFGLLQIKNLDQKGQNGGPSESSGNLTEGSTVTVISEASKTQPKPVYSFSSKPRSAPRSPRSRQRKQQDSGVGATPLEEKPEIKVYLQEPVEMKRSKSKEKGLGRDRRESERSEYDDDFYKASGESSAEEDDLQKLLKSSGNSRCSSRGSRMSPMASPQPSPESDPLSNSQILRMSIRSSLLKEIPSPRRNNTKTYEAKNYQSEASSWKNYQSTASSWRFDTSVMSSNMLDKSLDKSFNSSFGQDSGFPRDNLISSGTSGSEDGVIITNDGGDSLSDSSDDTTYSTWKVPPPPDKRQHRYLDEMRHPGPEPDLSATLPLDPREYSDAFSPPIVLPSQRIGSGQNNALSAALSPPRSRNPSTSMDHDIVTEEELDLLYDPCLNCYFDPRTHKYYELA